MTSSTTEAEYFLTIGRRVIARETEALLALGGALDAEFSRAVHTVLAAKGRVIVSGIGKSGHIARKIASTLASTGTLSHYVHPAEASHGDLGMIGSDDVVIILSNSGETTELSDLLAHVVRFSIPMIGIASRVGSTLLERADVPLLLPQVAEACEQGLVPTTSTTMMLALGDAIAIALMEQRSFTPEHFGVFHPGGKLGAKLVKVEALMHYDLPLVPPQTPMTQALLDMTRFGFGVLGVQEKGGALLGVITDGDLRRHMQGLLSLTVQEVMTKNPATTSPRDLAAKALALMQAKQITALFVTEGPTSGAIGLLHIHDCLRAGVV
ncbi:MAG: KpsF/GutQ family sugar-phosphate isomerase [Paracoccaceae bacterium]|jgi:arabinose-5-phosphate isomerase